jgi:hypothetical protein
MRDEILVATSPRQARALRAQGAETVVRTSFNYTEVTVPLQGGGTTILWRPFSTRKQRKCARAFYAILEARRA